MFWIIFTTIVVCWWLIARIVLSGPDLRRFDSASEHQHFPSHASDQDASAAFMASIKAVRHRLEQEKSIRVKFAGVRTFADELSSDLVTDTKFIPHKENGIDFEWAIAPGADPKRRVVFIHGGAFLFGSAKGHRRYADRLSKMVGGAVASVNYRMMPEHGRSQTNIDVQAVYRFVLENGPDGPAQLDYLLVSGDSAGGCLALMLSTWSKHSELRKPDAVVAFSPSTDATLASPTHKSNVATDPILGEGLGLLIKIPIALRAWLGLLSMRCNPSNPLTSPVFGDLADLPPTLIHASTSEMLLGDAIRYTNRAQSMGSSVTLQIWENQIHDWHLFNMGSGSAEAAWAEVQTFLDANDQKPSKLTQAA